MYAQLFVQADSDPSLRIQDKVLIVLSVAAVISLALGIYTTVGTEPHTYESTRCENNLCTEPQVEWVEGVAITIAIFIVVMVGSINDWQKERQFQKLNAQKEERNVKVLRDGQEKLMSVYDVVVGDILYVEPGEILPCDGLFLSGHNVRCDESGATGESDAVRKAPFEELNGTEKGKVDAFLLSGSKVLEGVGSYVAVNVGQNSFHGKIMMCKCPVRVHTLDLGHSLTCDLTQLFRVTRRTLLFSLSSTILPSSSPKSDLQPV